MEEEVVDSEVVIDTKQGLDVPGEAESKMLKEAEEHAASSKKCCKSACCSKKAADTQAPQRRVVLNNYLELVVRKSEGAPEVFRVERRCMSIVDSLTRFKEDGYTHVVSLLETENTDRSDPIEDGGKPFSHDIAADVHDSDEVPIDELIQLLKSNFMPPSRVIKDLQQIIERASIWSDMDIGMVGLTFHGGIPASFAFIAPTSGDLEVRIEGDMMDEQMEKYKDSMRRSRHIVFAHDPVKLM